MYSRKQFAALEAMCRKRAALAQKEMDYWLSEAEEWKQLRERSNPVESSGTIELVCLNTQLANEGICDWSNVPEVPQEA